MKALSIKQRKSVEELYADVPEWISTQEFPRAGAPA